jgi:hypothetical protein
MESALQRWAGRDGDRASEYAGWARERKKTAMQKAKRPRRRHCCRLHASGDSDSCRARRPSPDRQLWASAVQFTQQYQENKTRDTYIGAGPGQPERRARRRERVGGRQKKVRHRSAQVGGESRILRLQMGHRSLRSMTQGSMHCGWKACRHGRTLTATPGTKSSRQIAQFSL